ncbi:MAG: paraquat-inducible protein A [Gammaproteobacteria bacterium]|nr:paraquat-inducible protein A [Gammaproteobacteria bacterium]
MNRAIDVGLVACHCCGLLAGFSLTARQHAMKCQRCQAQLHQRIPDSLQKTWALVVTSAILYIPANLLPIMTVKQFGSGQAHTIMGGILELLDHSLYPIAILVFIASFLVPLLKIIGIILLLISVQQHWSFSRKERVLLFRLIEFVGRWSMLDIFMIALLTALVSLGQIAEIEAGQGATAFAAVVILTILAAKSFDTRLIWDHD